MLHMALTDTVIWSHGYSSYLEVEVELALSCHFIRIATISVY